MFKVFRKKTTTKQTFRKPDGVNYNKLIINIKKKKKILKKSHFEVQMKCEVKCEMKCEVKSKSGITEELRHRL